MIFLGEDMDSAIEMRGITKHFGSVTANKSVDFVVKSREIHCLLGENGAGKTTLMKILFGLYRQDEGEILIKGNVATIASPKDALSCGMGMVHQHFMLVNRMTALENIILGRETGRFLVDYKQARKELRELAKRYRFKIDLDSPVADLSVGEKQRVEILKTLYRGADILILDEPTAVLTPGEVDELFLTLQELKNQNKTIIFITHKLKETMDIADRITVLRNGEKVAEREKKATNRRELALLMVGREVSFDVKKSVQKPGAKVIEVEGLKLFPHSDKTISFSISEGEIFGIAGVEGNGQLELEEMMMGMRPIPSDGGSIKLNGVDISQISTKKRKLSGMGYIPSDRHKRAMLHGFSLEENMLLGYHFVQPFVKHGQIQKKSLSKHTAEAVMQYKIRTPDTNQLIKYLSGGNQQKLIVSREISRDPVFVLAAQPTRGLDVGAIEFVYELLMELRSEKKAVLLISAELSEIMQLSDRIGVLYEGEFMDVKASENFSRGEIGLLMAGSGSEEKANE